MQNYTFLAHFKLSDTELLSSKIEINIHLIKSPKRDHIYKLRFYMPEEHNCLILTSYHVPKLKYSSHARKY